MTQLNSPPLRRPGAMEGQPARRPGRSGLQHRGDPSPTSSATAAPVGRDLSPAGLATRKQSADPRASRPASL